MELTRRAFTGAVLAGGLLGGIPCGAAPTLRGWLAIAADDLEQYCLGRGVRAIEVVSLSRGFALRIVESLPQAGWSLSYIPLTNTNRFDSREDACRVGLEVARRLTAAQGSSCRFETS